MRAKLFSEILMRAPVIHAFAMKAFEYIEIFMLKHHIEDERYLDPPFNPYSEDFTIGDGSKDNPFEYQSAAPVSPHYAIVDLWYHFASEGGPTYIRANDWLFLANTEGVISGDGIFTRLLPKQEAKNEESCQ